MKDRYLEIGGIIIDLQNQRIKLEQQVKDLKKIEEEAKQTQRKLNQYTQKKH